LPARCARGAVAAPVPRLQSLAAAPVQRRLARAVAGLRRQQAVVERDDPVAARAGVEPAHQLAGLPAADAADAATATAERVLELVAVAPLLERRQRILELEAVEAAEPVQRLGYLGALDLQLALVGEHLPGNARVLGAGRDPLAAGHQHLERARVRVAALALV